MRKPGTFGFKSLGRVSLGLNKLGPKICCINLIAKGTTSKQTKNDFKRALPAKLRPPPPSPKRARWSFFWPSKQHYSAYCRIKFKLILIIKMMISVYSHIFDDYGDENDQKTDKYHGFLVKYTPFWTLLLGKKKRNKTTGQGSTPPPIQAMPN